MSFVAAALIVGGTTIGAAALSKKGGGDGVGFAGVPETKEAKEARKRLLAISKGPLPTIPLRERPPFEPIEFEKFPEGDFGSLPEVQAIIAESKEAGNILTGRLGRGLQNVGAFTTTPGRDILGRSVGEVEQGITARLAPFAAEERGRTERQFNIVRALGISDQLREMGITEAEFADIFEKELAESKQLEEFTIPLLQSIIGSQPPVQPFLEGQQPSTLSQILPLLGPILGAGLSPGGFLNPTPTPPFRGVA